MQEFFALETVYSVALREIRRFYRSRSLVFSSVFMPLLWLLILGIGFGATMKFVNPRLGSYFFFVFPGALGLNVFFTSTSAGINIISDREYGFFKEMLVSPASRISIVLGRVAGQGVASIIQGCLMLFLAEIFRIHFAGISILLVIPLIFFMGAGFYCAGMVIASFMDSLSGFVAVQNLLLIPAFFLSGALFPLQGLPSWLYLLTLINPLTYGIDLLRYLLLGINAFNPLTDFIAVTVFMIASAGASVWVFRNK